MVALEHLGSHPVRPAWRPPGCSQPPAEAPGAPGDTHPPRRARARRVITAPASRYPVTPPPQLLAMRLLLRLLFLREATSFPILSPEGGRRSTVDGLSRWLAPSCWLLLGATSLASAFFTALYSLELSRDQATSWLISMILSVLQNVFIIQPVKVRGDGPPPWRSRCSCGRLGN